MSTATISACLETLKSALATIAAAEDLPLHLAHLQFYGYGKEGPQGFSSAAPQLAEAVNAAKNVTIDVGQVMFGQTVTISSDVLRQFSARGQARPKKYAIIDGDSNGAGIVPYEYRAGGFHNAVQFAAGLELFLLIDDPWRVFFTTDHPNGAPFTTYPEIFALLMDKDVRAEWASRLPAEALAVTTLPSLTREYTLGEIATMTRAAPAKLLGLPDRGHLGAGARADVALYRPGKDIAQMFRAAARVYKDGELVVRDGEVTRYPLRPRAARDARRRSLNATADDGILRRTLRSAVRFHARAGGRHRAAATVRGGRMPRADGQRNRHRRHVRGSVRHARDRDRHHRADRTLGGAGGHDDDGLRHLGDRVRLRGGRRERSVAATNAGWTARRARAYVCGLDRGAAEATAKPRRAMRAHQPRFGLLRRARLRRRQAQARRRDSFLRRRLADRQAARRPPILARAGDGRRVRLRSRPPISPRRRSAAAISLSWARAAAKTLAATEAAVEAMRKVADVIMPFPGGIARSGSKVGSKYKGASASTNDLYCPTLKGAVDSALLPEIASVLEIVIDGLTSEAVAEAMRAGLAAIVELGPERGALRVGAGNYGGKLGRHHYHLKDLLP